MKHTIKHLTALLLSALLLTSCGVPTEPQNTTAALGTTAATASGEAATDASLSDETEAPAPTYLDPASLPMIYTQEDVCGEPAIKSYKKFAQCAAEEFIVPGLNQSMVPQGMDYWADRNWILISGYCTDETLNGGKGSVILAVDAESGEMMGEYYLKNADGTYHDSHVGGVAVTKKNVFISNASTLYRIPLSAFDEAKQCGDVTIVEEIAVPVSASFANFSGGILWVGDFQYSTSYPTDEFRHMKNRQGSMYYAWTVGYALDETTENELKASAMVKDSFATPDYVLSITERIQGMTYLPEAGKVVLSQSYGRTNDSMLYLYDDPLGDAPHATTTLNGVSVPVWFLDSKMNQKNMSALPMSEGIANVNGEVYVLFESGANKYRLGGGKLPTDMVYSVDVTKY